MSGGGAARRDGKIAIWQAAFNVSRADQASTVAELIR
jgi:hypothetical protein